MIDTKPKPHYRCFVCLRKLGYGYGRTARVFKVNSRNVCKWLKYHDISMPRPVQKIKPKPPKRDFSIKFARSKNRRKLTAYLRSKIWRCFKHDLHTPSAEKMLGCSRAHFIAHIQGRLKRGMTMKNYGTVWELDHILPCKLFNLELLPDVLTCFHWSNYQPLFITENRRKFTKVHHQMHLFPPLLSTAARPASRPPPSSPCHQKSPRTFALPPSASFCPPFSAVPDMPAPPSHP